MTQLERYLAFSKNAWGALANVSLLFPFSVALSDALRTSVEFQLLTAVLCAGAVFTAWVGRPVYWLRELKGNRAFTLVNIGSALLGLGVSLVFAYVLISLNGALAIWSDARPALYLLGFSLLTGGFAMLGLKEYFLTVRDLGFEPAAFLNQIVEVQLFNLARNYLRCRPEEIRVTNLSTAATGIQLRIVVRQQEEYDVRITDRGAIERLDKI